MNKKHIGSDFDDFLRGEQSPDALDGQGDRAAFDRVLADVPAVPPDPWDRWDEAEPGPSREPK